MGLIDKLFGRKANAKPEPAQDKPEPSPPKKKEVTKSAKEIATEKGEPYVAIVGFDVDSKNLHQGAFELDWNDKFIADLVRAGYMIKKDDTDAEIVDRWFQTVCRHVVMETYEQTQAMSGATSGRWTQTRDIGNGRSEIS